MKLESEPFETGDGTRKNPGRFYYEGKWRELGSWEIEWAQWLRRTLAVTDDARLVTYIPTEEEDPGFNTRMADHRAALHDIVDEICRQDLDVLYTVAHLLFASYRDGRGPLEMLILREAHIIIRLQAQGYGEYTADHLQRLGVLTRKLEALDALDVTAILDDAQALLAEAWGSRQDST